MEFGGFVIGNGGAVIADLRVSENDNLPGMGDQRRFPDIPMKTVTEDYFARNGLLGFKNSCPRTGAVFQSQIVNQTISSWGVAKVKPLLRYAKFCTGNVCAFRRKVSFDHAPVKPGRSEGPPGKLAHRVRVRLVQRAKACTHAPADRFTLCFAMGTKTATTLEYICTNHTRSRMRVPRWRANKSEHCRNFFIHGARCGWASFSKLFASVFRFVLALNCASKSTRRAFFLIPDVTWFLAFCSERCPDCRIHHPSLQSRSCRRMIASAPFARNFRNTAPGVCA